MPHDRTLCYWQKPAAGSWMLWWRGWVQDIHLVIQLTSTAVCVQAPVAFELVAASREGVRVRVRNKDTFVSTADLRLRWRLVLDGSPLALPRLKTGADGYYAVGDLDVPAQVGRAGRPLCGRLWSCHYGSRSADGL